MNIVQKLTNFLKFAAILTIAIFYMSPFLMVIVNSFKQTSEIILNPFKLPESFSFANYLSAAIKMKYWNAFLNTLIITSFSITLIVIFSSMAAYIFVRKNWSINKIVFSMMIASMIIPFQSIMIPLVKIYGSLNLLNNKWTLIYMYLGFGTSFAVFMYHGFIKGIPYELEEAALVDGASEFQTFWKIVFPLLKPVTYTIVILDSLWIWNDFLLPSLVLISAEKRTLQLSTFYFYGTYNTDYGLAMAALMLAIIPIIIIYLLLQKYIIAGIMKGAIK
ncbi:MULTISPECIES: carbohydrate ABC transporter permease [Dictyoglomus]|jgi:raffinose/stachyose/melibiose transport system permease protein|uniref:sn-glycerol-3-phosphate transport system permease protein UgpE n=1 Tax=Dictyoglomus turgidum (strain DSM 6724 / Z-1310) TaxID=515635 RepID=B8DZA7_DICTD|nr:MULTISPECIES: carbohydrate ABC transporter permease [Dictyoglomus]ACK41840.1 binding-protein-dependent transport systems inner membrane component [Dictyoglomus turgidum DSM 6724]PNV79723.1 MAG: carbohydrate ABC transporter permease [Dictyoglomus turgidum]HBU31305.1 carbohydrate ABC transporter permease [Dictyoglomus sp.]